MRNDLPPGVTESDIAQDVAEMINREDSLDRESSADTEAGDRTKEGTCLRACLISLGVAEPEACASELMQHWTPDQGVFNYRVGDHVEIFYPGYQLSHYDGQWMFSALEEGLTDFFDIDLRNGLKEAKVNKRDNRFLGGKK